MVRWCARWGNRTIRVLAVVTIAPYGTWTSPIGVDVVASAGGGPTWVGHHRGQVWWAEARPNEGGRIALSRALPDGRRQDVLTGSWNVRNRVHEYGGHPWVVIDTVDGDRLVFTNWDDQRLYLVDPDGTAPPVPISPLPDRYHGYRYADLTAGPDKTEVWCVRETVTGDRPTDVRRDLVALPLSASGVDDVAAVRVLASSHHFMTGPKVSPDGRRATWIGWDHPAMPWDGTQLCVADLDDRGELGPHRVVAGGPTEAVCQVEWDGPESLLVMTDPDGWWNLHRITLAGASVPVARNLAPCQEELGGPLWRLGSRWFADLGSGRIAVCRSGRLALIDETTGVVSDVPVDLPVWSPCLAAVNGCVVGIAAGPKRSGAVVSVDVSSGALTALTSPPPDSPDPDYLPTPCHRVFRDAAGQPIPAYVYPPTNPDFVAPEGEPPPFLVHVHGGPTGAFSPGLDLSIAFFTSRGIGVVAVNYGGSTGYGREFRERLREQWGVVDVADCAAVAEALAAAGDADARRLAIRGGSAGGWTAAASLTSVRTYRCGTVMYPILDLAGWTAEGGQTHDFESRYVEGLVGPLPACADRYEQRSPARHADRLAGPVLMLQGLDDQICPPVQADEFMSALDGSGIPHAYLTFPGEQHGFRKAETIRTALNAELSFYGQVLGFTPPSVETLPLRR